MGNRWFLHTKIYKKKHKKNTFLLKTNLTLFSLPYFLTSFSLLLDRLEAILKLKKNTIKNSKNIACLFSITPLAPINTYQHWKTHSHSTKISVLEKNLHPKNFF